MREFKIRIVFFVFIAFCVILASCRDERTDSGDEEIGTGADSEFAKPRILVTIPPLAMILRNIAGDEFDIECILPPGSSPHTYEPSPSIAEKATKSQAMFYIGAGLDDWATRFESKNKIAVFDLLPVEYRKSFSTDENLVAGDEHYHDHSHNSNHFDPHFWTSPKAVIAISILLFGELIRLNPDGRAAMQENLRKFEFELVNLDKDVSDKLSAYSGENVILFHPSMNYFLADYGLYMAGVIEVSAGAESSPRKIAELARIVKAKNVKAIFTEPQLSKSAAHAIAGEAGVPVFELDPLGGSPGRETYIDFIQYNVDTLIRAFKSGDETP